MLLFITAYDEDSASTESEATTTEPASFSQEQVNAFNKAERLKREGAEAKLKETEILLAQMRNEKNLTETEKEELNTKLEEIEQSKMSETEKREHELTKLKETFESEKNDLASQLKEVQASRDELVITRAIRENALDGSIVALDGTGNQVLAVLKHQTSVNEEGEVVVQKFTYKDGDDIMTEDLPIKEAIEKMKSADEWANFWKDPSKKGFHTPQDGAPRGPLNVSKLSQAEYSKLRKQGKVPYANPKGTK